MKKFIAMLVCLVLLLSLFAGCAGGTTPDSSKTESKPNSNTTSADDTVTLRFFTLNADRTSGEGLTEQTIIDAYVADHPNIKIEVEALENEAYKQKIKAYAASDDLPDIFASWSSNAFIGPMIDGGLVAELNEDDYADYTFQENALNLYRKNDKLYGLPRSMEGYVVYYNRRIFKENNLTIPQTFEEMLEIGDTLRANGIMPCAINGGEKWGFGAMYSHVLYTYTLDDQRFLDAVRIREPRFADDPAFLHVAEAFAEMGKRNFFQDSYLTDDFGAMQNLFQQEQVAMMYMGNFLSRMYYDENIPQEVRDNFGAFALPPLEGSKGKSSDGIGGAGNGYSLAAHSEHLEEARDFLNYMMLPDNWVRLSWKQGGHFSAQDMTPYITEDEKTGLIGDLINYMDSFTSAASDVIVEAGSPTWKTESQDWLQELVGGMITPEEFITLYDEGADRSFEEMNAKK